MTLTRSQPEGLLGAQRPRYQSLPSSVSLAAGDDAIELAETAGLFLDDWQQYVIRQSLAERPGGRWAASEVGLIVPRQNGKGSVLEARELAGLFLFEDSLILHSAHEFKTASEAFLRIKTLIDNTDSLRKRIKKILEGHDKSIELKNGARLQFVARSRGSGRGFSGDLVVLDEAYSLSDAAMDALMPTLSARPNAQIWYTSSAPLDDSEVLRRLCLRGRAGDDERLAYFEWCADEGALRDDRLAWAQANPSLGIRLTEEFTERELAALSPEGFERERLGIWSESETTAILPHWPQLADERSSLPAGAPVVFAIDVAPNRGRSTIAVVGERPDGNRHVEILANEPETFWLLDRLRAMRDKAGEIAVVVDDRSAAGSLIPSLEAEKGITVHVPSSKDVAAASGRFFDACSASVASLRHLNDPVLNAAVDAAVTRPLGDSWAWDRRKPTADITPLVAATLALWGWETHGKRKKRAPIFVL